MEVEAHAVSAFDLNHGGNFPAYSFSAMSASSDEALPHVADQMSVNGGQREDSAAPPSSAAVPSRCPMNAAKRVQKVYRSYRTRRMLADSAVVVEELWWQALDFARLNHSTISFFDFLKPETATSRWNRARWNASKVGKGLSRDAKAQKLAFQHWIEAIDPRHRYGHSLHLYYEEWCKTNTGQPFFYWLDLGDGRDFELKECPRSKLRQQCIKYLGPIEREHYEYEVVDGKFLHKLTGKPLDTSQGSGGSKWIFVMSTFKRLYIGEKRKGLFHHSSFLAGGATLAAGRLTAEDGVLKGISAYSGHYKPTDDILDSFLSFLRENGVNLNEVEIQKPADDYESSENGKASLETVNSEGSISDSIPSEVDGDVPSETTKASKPETCTVYKRSLSGGLQSPKADVPRTSLLQRINSKKAVKSYQLGHQLPTRWSTGAGPRIGCIADYPVELRLQALELTNLSPRSSPPSWTPRRASAAAIVSPSAYPPNVSSEELEDYFKV
ncbi:IQ domain-containing protein IQM3-like [Salvia miltiorrhiza]|uniref:IQ domain-containing protein IQM3-like n=1 Tax=Salvia miltiorrhiza TaxID=226208 RepID=UPI0025ACFA7E|nr:IQ domain-containing protein IQM3-like [Salvia miltiorrhiza]